MATDTLGGGGTVTVDTMRHLVIGTFKGVEVATLPLNLGLSNAICGGWAQELEERVPRNQGRCISLSQLVCSRCGHMSSTPHADTCSATGLVGEALRKRKGKGLE